MREAQTDRAPSFWELAVQATSSTRQGYNLLAPRFEATEYATPIALIAACRRRVDRLYPLPRRADSWSADLACGTGRAVEELLTSSAKVDGYDLSPGMLAVAQQQSGRRDEAVRFLEADLATIELPPKQYDRIVSFGAWGHVLPNWRARLIAQIGASLKPGGVFYTITADPASPWQRRWWHAVLFDSAISLRNHVLGNPFHMYYRLNDTLTLKRVFEDADLDLEVRLEPVPGSPHPELTLLMVIRSPEAN